jgi:23S rRNA maturation mini-RNase III
VLFAQGDVVYEMVVRDYFNFLRAYVERMHRIVDVCFSNSTSLKAKTVGPVMFEHEVTKLLSVKRTVA